MVNQDWFFYYSLLKKYYIELAVDGYISEEELEDCLELMHTCTLGEIQEECSKLGLADVPYIVVN